RMPLSPPNATATTEIHTLSLHDALPIFHAGGVEHAGGVLGHLGGRVGAGRDRGLADPAVVEADHPEASRQTRDERLPAPAGVPEPLYEDDRVAGTGLLPRDRHVSVVCPVHERILLPIELSPPGAKSISSTNRVPRTNSGSESGPASQSGRASMASEVATPDSR